jgi:diacylglycerol kinase
MSNDRPHGLKRSWADKFRDAFGGIRQGVRGQSSFTVHIMMAAAVVIVAALLKATVLEWCILLICITMVLVAEMFNTALEHLAKGVTDRHDRNVGLALEIASGAVLMASIGASAVGAIVFINLLV